MTPLIAEDLLLLLLDDESGKFTNATYLATGIGGALLVELALAGNVEVVKGAGLWARAKVLPTAAASPSDPVLLEALDVVAQKERTAQDLVDRLGRKRRDQLLGRLRERGVVEEREDRVLGLIPRRRWPTVDGTHEADVRRRLGEVLLDGTAPDERTAALVALLSALDVVHRVVEREGRPAREVKARAKEIAEGDWAAQAVRDAVTAAQAAVAAAVIAASAAATASNG
jgi:hypothetical protein